MDQLHRLFQLCNQVRYAPVQSAEDLLQVLPQVESALKGLQELPDEGQA